MEIVTYVLEGALAHKDSMGNGATIVPGDVQHMSAGTGVLHSEFNACEAEPVHFVQIWIVPDRAGYAPSYGQTRFEAEDRPPASRRLTGRSDGSLTIQQDARMYASVLEPGPATSFALPKDRHLWVQSLRGTVDVNGHELSAGDGLAASDETAFTFKAPKVETEFLVFDLA